MRDRLALIADDSATMRLLLRRILEPVGWKVVEATDGESAVEMSRREQPDLVLLDWTMPRSSGIEACRALRSQPRLNEVAVIMISGHGADHREMALAAGADGFLQKPFGGAELLDEILRVVGGDPRGAE